MAQARLGIIGYAWGHSLDEFLGKALDEIGGLFQSSLGFYHLLGEDKKTLSLQRWSTLTVDLSWKAEGGHSSADRADLWAQCVSEKRPVIHNDFDSLPWRKDLPEGHPAIERLLVAPVVRGDKVVAVLGLGNKPVDYTQRDAETVSYLAGITWGVAERTRLKQALGESEGRYRTVVEKINDAIFMVDPEGKITYMSPAIERMSRYKAAELVEMRFTRLVHPEDLPRMIGLFRGVLEGQIGSHESRLLQKDGSVRFVRTHRRPLAEGGRVVRVTGVMTDITDRRLAEAESERLVAAIEQAGEAVVITNSGGAIRYVNPAFERVTGYARDEVLGQNPRILKSGKHGLAFSQDLWGTISSGGTWSGMMVNTRKDGTLYTEDSTISPVLDGSGRVLNYVAVKRGVTEHLRLAAEFQQVQDMEAVGRLGGGGARLQQHARGHPGLCGPGPGQGRGGQGTQGGSPGGAQGGRAFSGSGEETLGLCPQAGGEAPGLGSERRGRGSPEDAQEAHRGGDRSDLGARGRALEGEGGPLPGGPDPGETLRERQGCDIRGRQSGDRDGQRGLRRGLLQRARGVRPWGVCNVGGERWRVWDEQGGGRGDGPRIGRGLRDSETKRRLRERVQRRAKGTTVKVYLPRWTGEGEVVREPKVPDVPRGRGETVLVVEDEKAVLRMAGTVLESLGYQILTASGPAEATDVARGHSGEIDLLLVDVVMPEMDTKELVGRLKALRPILKHLYMSGYTANVIATRGVLGEGIHFIQKPFSMEGLARKVREAMGWEED